MAYFTAVYIKQERRLKRLITLGGLEIGMQHPPPPPHHHPPPTPPPPSPPHPHPPTPPPPPSPPHTPPTTIPPTPPPHTHPKKIILVIRLVEKNVRTVKQCIDLKTSSIPLQSLEAQLSSLSLVAVLLILFVCHVHSGSRQYSWFSRISSTVANRYRNFTSLLKRSVSITSIL